jgi:hypothetical protein
MAVGASEANAAPAVSSVATIKVERIFMAVSGCRCRLQRGKFCGDDHEPSVARALRKRNARRLPVSQMLHPSPVQRGETRAIDEQDDCTSTGRGE